MNTIPTTSKKIRIPYTVVGGKKIDKRQRTPAVLSVCILNRGGRLYRKDFFEEIQRMGSLEIISIEGPGAGYDQEQLVRKYPNLRFLNVHTNISQGERVNIGIEEAHGKYIFILWDDVKLLTGTLSTRFLDKLQEEDPLCTVPVISNPQGEPVPSIMSPAFYRNKLKVLPFHCQKENTSSLFPFDYMGIYCKERFTQVGGYDYSIEHPYWQKMDFGFRVHMWGERIVCNGSFRLGYEGEVPAEDTTPNEDYRRFFLKNLSVRFVNDRGILPFSGFFPYWFKTGNGIIDSWKQFKAVREWVNLNGFRFQRDARGVTELWEIPE
jgi:hypothetical protein